VRQALKDSVMLAVDGQQLGLAVTDLLHKQRSCHHQRLLIRQQHPLPGMGGRQCGQ
jgi:hypothetical protein